MKKTNKKYLRFLLEYLKHHKYFKSRNVAIEWFEKYEMTTDKYMKIRKQRIIRLTRLYGHYMAVIRKQEYIARDNRKGSVRTLKRSIGMVKGINELLADVKMDKWKHIKHGTRNIDNLDVDKYDWNTFEEMESSMLYEHESRHTGKTRMVANLYFLGKAGNMDPHFCELFEQG